MGFATQNAKCSALCKVFAIRSISLFRKTQLAHHKIVDNNLIIILLWKGGKHLNIDSTDSNMQVKRTDFSVSSVFKLHSMIEFGVWIALYL